MFGPNKIMKWCDNNLQGMRRSRRSALASICAGAMKMKGVGVLALGRAMEGPVNAKHRIKRVDRLLGNEQLEVFELSKSLFNALRGQEKRPLVLVDWTDRKAFEQLVFSMAKDGRSMPFHAMTIESTHFKAETQGAKVGNGAGRSTVKHRREDATALHHHHARLHPSMCIRRHRRTPPLRGKPQSQHRKQTRTLPGRHRKSLHRIHRTNHCENGHRKTRPVTYMNQNWGLLSGVWVSRSHSLAPQGS